MFRVNKMMCRTGLWMVIMCCVTSYKLYKEKRAINLEENMYDEDYIDPEQNYPLELSPNPVKDLMLYKLFHSLVNLGDALPRVHYRPKFRIMQYPMAPFDYIPAPELMDSKDAIVKRSIKANSSAPTVEDNKKHISEQPKWKGRKLRFRLCFFKVCKWPKF